MRGKRSMARHATPVDPSGLYGLLHRLASDFPELPLIITARTGTLPGA
ncbi:hypothetical protein [Streptomyces sp. ID05-47C]|nr:hypothetical protein [Streptomyces sp. ID05-47C]MDX3573506.1 hypothetical protein [Streptomyces sp. ID05-47C]